MTVKLYGGLSMKFGTILYGVTPMADSGFYTKIMPKNAQKNEHISKTA